MPTVYLVATVVIVLSLVALVNAMTETPRKRADRMRLDAPERRILLEGK